MVLISMVGSNEGGGKRIQASKTAFAIVEALYDLDGAGVSQVANELGLAKSTAHAHLSTLADAGYIIREGDQYHVGLRFVDLGEYAKSRKDAYTISHRMVEQLAEKTQERSQFIVEEHGWGVYVHRELGEHAVHTDPGIGRQIPLHSTAAGKAILAELPRERVEQIIEQRGLEAVTENTITDREVLYEELDTIRERGYAFNMEENVLGLHAIGVGVKGEDGTICGALSVSGPSHRLTGDVLREEIPALLLGTANELELNLMHS
jgi:DNA-binding IclR family transcriptional regulator